MPGKEQYMEVALQAIGLVILAFVISIPFGYLRQYFAKYSIMWFFLIHLPIPFIVVLRVKAGLDWHFIPFTLAGSIAGQIFGGALSRRKKQNGKAT
jgi:hypothetical protein